MKKKKKKWLLSITIKPENISVGSRNGRDDEETVFWQDNICIFGRNLTFIYLNVYW